MSNSDEHSVVLQLVEICPFHVEDLKRNIILLRGSFEQLRTDTIDHSLDSEQTAHITASFLNTFHFYLVHSPRRTHHAAMEGKPTQLARIEKNDGQPPRRLSTPQLIHGAFYRRSSSPRHRQWVSPHDFIQHKA
ncbi:MAG: hypothetical protein Q9187_002468 [Circinaria calcarea]